VRRGPLVLGAAVAVAAVATGLLVVRDDGSGGRSVDASVRCSAGDVDALDLSDPDQGEPTWSEEFDGAGRGRAGLDPQRWTVRDATTLSFDQARIRADNVSVADGTLRITARDDAAGDPSGLRPVTTGYVDTIGHFSQRYGRWEVRARLPVAPGESRGLWPAFWLRADDLPGEIDVVEAWGTPAARPRDDMASQYAWTVHEDTNAPRGYRRVGGWGSAAGPLADDFHVFAVDWVPGCLRFSLDGRTTGHVDLDREPRLAAALDDEMNIRLNLQVGGRYWGRLDPEQPGSTRLPATLEVDHVRVYRPRS
jgi:beta-glucanase (GH16 family)